MINLCGASTKKLMIIHDANLQGTYYDDLLLAANLGTKDTDGKFLSRQMPFSPIFCQLPG
jgi:ABC-type hemin transport system ATPase subunit